MYILNIVYSILLWIFWLIEACLLMIIAFLVFGVSYPFDPKRKAIHIYSGFWGLQYFWLNPLWKIKYVNNANIDPNKNYVIVCNHQSMFDICLMYKIKLVFKWVAKKEVFRLPFVGWLLTIHGDIKIDRGDSESAKEMIKKASEWIAKGSSISIFPEGTRSADGKIHEFKDGAFMIAKLNKLPIIPVVMEGTARILPPSSLILGGRTTAQIHVLPIISEEAVASMKTRDLSKMLHDIMLEKHKEIAAKKYVD